MHSGLEEAVERLGHRIVVGITGGPDGGDRSFGGQSLAVANRNILSEFNRSLLAELHAMASSST